MDQYNALPLHYSELKDVRTDIVVAPSEMVRQTDRQTDRHVFIWGLIQRKYIDYNSK